MEKKNYNKFLKQENKTDVSTTSKNVKGREEQVELEKHDVPKFKKGFVVNCEKLNVRESPNKSSKVLDVLTVGSSLEFMELNDKKIDWYKVITNKKVEGYCMKEFIHNKE